MDIFEQINSFVSSAYFKWILYGVLIYLGVLWLALIAWVARDVIGRSRSLLFQTLMILLNMGLPVFGLFVYLLLRPPKTLMERYYDEVEIRLLKDASEDEEHEEKPKKKKKK
jgi:hypothetical protein